MFSIQRRAKRDQELIKQWRHGDGPQEIVGSLKRLLGTAGILGEVTSYSSRDLFDEMLNELRGKKSSYRAPYLSSDDVLFLATSRDDHCYYGEDLAFILQPNKTLALLYPLQDYLFIHHSKHRWGSKTGDVLIHYLGARAFFHSTAPWKYDPMWSDSDYQTIAVFDHKLSDHERERIRLILTSLDLVSCTTAGEGADRLHRDFAAECRLASYHGFILNGSSKPKVIEKAIISEAQSMLHADLIASTPDVEVSACSI